MKFYTLAHVVIYQQTRKDLYKKLVKLKVNSNFQKIASNGSAYNFIRPEIVCEIKLLNFKEISLMMNL